MATGKAVDIQLAEDLLAGLPGAFDRFVETYRQKIFQYSYLMCGHREDAEEVAQETLLKVFEKLEQLREPEAIKGWVFRIARNNCFMKRRKSTFAPERELSLDELVPSFRQDGEERKMEIADWKALPDAQAIHSQMAGKLHSAMEALPDIYRSVIILRDMEELSTEETADVLGIGQDTVKTRLHRARLAVRRTLDEHLRAAGVAQ